jgi:4-hydroxybenzoate polyprenyltransferase
VTAVLPAIGSGWPLSTASIITSAAALTLVLFRSLLFDLADVRSDRILGAETLPALAGETLTRWATIFLLVATGGLLLAGGLTALLPPLALWLLLVLAPLAVFMALSMRGAVLSHIVVPIAVDGAIFLMGLVALAWKIAS